MRLLTKNDRELWRRNPKQENKTKTTTTTKKKQQQQQQQQQKSKTHQRSAPLALASQLDPVATSEEAIRSEQVSRVPQPDSEHEQDSYHSDPTRLSVLGARPTDAQQAIVTQKRADLPLVEEDVKRSAQTDAINNKTKQADAIVKPKQADLKVEQDVKKTKQANTSAKEPAHPVKTTQTRTRLEPMVSEHTESIATERTKSSVSVDDDHCDDLARLLEVSHSPAGSDRFSSSSASELYEVSPALAIATSMQPRLVEDLPADELRMLLLEQASLFRKEFLQLVDVNARCVQENRSLRQRLQEQERQLSALNRENFELVYRSIRLEDDLSRLGISHDPAATPSSVSQRTVSPLDDDLFLPE